jgi:tetratricopeptide (TPR) repeat protein
MTAADKYYLKARDLYPFEIEEALEALDYGLSCDDTHAGLITLRGEIYYKDLKRFDAAAECFELALYHDPGFVDAYYLYIKLLTETDEAKTAERLIAQALTVKGIEKSRVWYIEGLLYEKQGMYTLAVGSMNNANVHCQCCKECRDLYKTEGKRIQKKGKRADVKANGTEVVPTEQATPE